MKYRITGLSPEPYLSLYGLSEDALALRGVIRYRVTEHPGFPDRIEMQDVKIGETVLLLNHICQPANTPYRASHAIFIREGATRRFDETGVIPEVMQTRLLSLRAYSSNGMMVDAEIARGDGVPGRIERLFDSADVDYIHAHNAVRGCFSGRIDRT